jgi:ABC-2 type transport system permease protein
MTTAPLRKTNHRLSHLGMLLALSKTEIIKLFRNPAFIIATLALPIMFFAIFGMPYAKESIGGMNAAKYMLISYCAYGLMTVCITSFGNSIANERGMGWNRILKVAPMPPVLYFVAKTVAALFIGTISILALLLFAAVVGGVTFTPLLAITVFAKLLLGMTPFIAIGLAIGYNLSSTAAPAISNLVFLMMSFASGLFVPLENAPQFIRDMAPYLPAYHFAELGWMTLGGKPLADQMVHWLWLGGYLVLFLALAYWGYRRDEGKKS